MLSITIPSVELFNEATNEIISTVETALVLEHSLISLSKWESVHKKPFLGKGEKTAEETRDYIKQMTITKNVPPEVFTYMPPESIKAISDYISDPMTATTFVDRDKGRTSYEVITNEIIYYWMTTFSIPFGECEKWHLNRLLTLIRVCSIKSQPPKKMSRSEVASRNRELNAARLAAHHTTG